MESHECSLDIVLSHFMGHNNDDSSAVLPPDFDINSCRGKIYILKQYFTNIEHYVSVF